MAHGDVNTKFNLGPLLEVSDVTVDSRQSELGIYMWRLLEQLPWTNCYLWRRTGTNVWWNLL